YASASEPQAALAMVTVPHGPALRQEQFLREVLEGALQALRPAGVPIVGGHTIAGAQATVGFTLLGDSDPQRRTRKAGLRVGDQLVLTKPLGTGILLAAHSQALCEADWWEAVVASMLQTNRETSRTAQEVGVQAMTDVTGFGLAGHLCEMLVASGVSAEISLESLPVLPGAEDLVEQGIESTLAPGNREIEQRIRAADAVRRFSKYQLLFDPQTSGGILIGGAKEQLASLMEQLSDSAKVIGQVCEALGEGPVLRVH
ncbi:MAG: selenide, water dikinase SelD, partial [Lacipirellulaceae bacterium]